MNKNIWIVLLIILVPICAYWGLTKNRLADLPSIASEGDVVLKFSSPMCYECQELEKVFEKVFPKYNNDVQLQKIDVTKNDQNTRMLIKQYDVKLVPTTVFRNQDGKMLRRIEGCVKPETLEIYMKELINE